MATTIFNKKQILEWVDRNVKDDQLVLMTMDMTGSCTVSPKNNQKKVSFVFAADAFKAKDDIRDLAFRQTPSVCFAICDKMFVSEEAIKMLEEALKKD